MKRQAVRSLAGLAVALLLGAAIPPLVAQDAELTRLQKRFVTGLTEEIEKAERYLQRDRADQSLRFHDRAVQELAGIAGEDLSPLLMESLQPLLKRLEEVRGGLVKLELKPAEIPAMAGAGGESAPFSAIAAILVNRCGNCHVRQSRGEFSMANWRALMESGQVVARDPVGSRLVQVLETGEMPPNGNRIPDGEFDLIRAWVAAGAAGEGDAEAPLGSLVPGGGNAAAPAPMAELARPTGKETVSFSRDVAPLLIANCRGCHLDSDRPRGNLNITTITGLLRGGDGGGPLVPGRGSESLLVRKLKGTADGQRMPQGSPPLSADAIGRIEKWIDEGATFDGDDPANSLQTLVAVGEVRGMDHDQLTDRRKSDALKRWETIFQGIEPRVVVEDDFLLLTSLAEPKRDPALAQIRTAIAALREGLGIPPGEPLVKGRFTVFVLDKQYDFSEFSRMVLQRPADAGAVTFWGYDPVDAWMVVLVGDAANDELRSLGLTRDAAALHFSSLTRGVPRWFADSMGWVIAARVLPKNPGLREAQAAAVEVSNRMKSRAEITDPRTAPKQAALGGFYVLAGMLNNRSRIEKLVREMKAASGFEAGFTAAFGAASDAVFGGNKTP